MRIFPKQQAGMAERSADFTNGLRGRHPVIFCGNFGFFWR